MAQSFSVFTNLGTNEPVSIDRLPDVCPWCHNGIEPRLLTGFLQKTQRQLFLFLCCTRHECQSLFIGVYNQNSLSNNFQFQATLLGARQVKKFSSIIEGVSNGFVKIYNQAEISEQFRLDEICGPGFRKSLEFLIKDYIISKDNSLRERVEGMHLGQCIDAFISDLRIKALAKRAVWIGNDETHYIKKWILKDIDDLKSFIELVVHWIETEILTENMIASMPETGPV